jgi:hypothetical protein
MISTTSYSTQYYTLEKYNVIFLNQIHVIKFVQMLEADQESATNYQNDLIKNRYAFQNFTELIVYKVESFFPNPNLQAFRLKTRDGKDIGWVIGEFGLKRIQEK